MPTWMYKFGKKTSLKSASFPSLWMSSEWTQSPVATSMLRSLAQSNMHQLARMTTPEVSLSALIGGRVITPSSRSMVTFGRGLKRHNFWRCFFRLKSTSWVNYETALVAFTRSIETYLQPADHLNQGCKHNDGRLNSTYHMYITISQKCTTGNPKQRGPT